MLDMIMAYAKSVSEREEGQALVEYALILALVSVASVVALTALGTSISGILTSITGSL